MGYPAKKSHRVLNLIVDWIPPDIKKFRIFGHTEVLVHFYPLLFSVRFDLPDERFPVGFTRAGIAKAFGSRAPPICITQLDVSALDAL